MTQRELSAMSGVPQPNIAAYETGRRMPSPSTMAKLDAAFRTPSLGWVQALREQILMAADRRGLSDVRVFGSVARGTADETSDVDVLVHPSESASIFDLEGFMAELAELLGVRVDVVSDRGTGPTMDRIRREAVPL